MPQWFDKFPGSPVVFYEFGDGSSTAVPRDRAQAFGFVPEVTQAPVAPLPPVPVPPAGAPEFELPEENAADIRAAQVPTSVPEGAGFMFGRQAPAPGAPTRGLPPPVPVPEPPPPVVSGPPTAPIGDLPPLLAPETAPGGVPSTRGPIGGGSAPGAALPPAPEFVPPEPSLLEQREGVDQEQAAATRDAVETTGREIIEQQRRDANARVKEQQQKQDHWNAYSKDVEKAANHKVDPNRYWNNMGTGRKIGTVLAMLVSGLGSAIKKQGDRNPALDMIMGFIRDDVSLQVMEGQKLERNIDQRRTALDMLGANIKDNEARRQAAIGAIGMRESQKIREAAAKAQDEGVKLSYLQLADDLQAASHQAAVDGWFREQDFMMKAAKTEAEIEKLRAEAGKLRGQTGGGGGGGASKSTIGAYQNLDQIDPKLHDQAVRLPDGSWVIAPDADSAKKARESVGSSRVMVQNIDRALSKVTGIPGWSKKIAGKLGFEGEDIAVIKQELSQLLLNGKSYYQLGALSENDAAIINRLGADPGAADAFVQQVWPKLQNWRGGITSDAVAKLHSLGIDMDADNAYGKAPSKPQDKTTEQLESELTSSPELLTPEERADGISAIEESYKRDGLSPKETAKRLKAIESQLAAGEQRAESTVKAKTAELEKLTKKRKPTAEDKKRIIEVRFELDEAKAQKSDIGASKSYATGASRYQASGGTSEGQMEAQKREKKLRSQLEGAKSRLAALESAERAMKESPRPKIEEKDGKVRGVKDYKQWKATRGSLKSQIDALRSQIKKLDADLGRARGITVD